MAFSVAIGTNSPMFVKLAKIWSNYMWHTHTHTNTHTGTLARALNCSRVQHLVACFNSARLLYVLSLGFHQLCVCVCCWWWSLPSISNSIEKTTEWDRRNTCKMVSSLILSPFPPPNVCVYVYLQAVSINKYASTELIVVFCLHMLPLSIIFVVHYTRMTHTPHSQYGTFADFVFICWVLALLLICAPCVSLYVCVCVSRFSLFSFFVALLAVQHLWLTHFMSAEWVRMHVSYTRRCANDNKNYVEALTWHMFATNVSRKKNAKMEWGTEWQRQRLR